MVVNRLYHISNLAANCEASRATSAVGSNSERVLIVPNKDSIVANLKSLIPGYGAYHALESRREDDRLTRNFLVKRIDQCKAQLDAVGAQAARSGDLESPLQIEKLRTELDRARSRLAAAVEGYSGWFSSRVVDEKLLTQISELDANLVSVVDLLGKQLEESPLPFVKVKESTDLLHQRIDRRGELLKQG